MHSSYTVHHPPVTAAAPITSPVPTSTTVYRPASTTMSSPKLTTTAVKSSWSNASRFDQGLFLAGVVTFTSAAAYAGYRYWQRTSKTAARTSKAATSATASKGCGCATGKPQASQPQSSTSQLTEYAAATAVEQLSKPQQPTTTTSSTAAPISITPMIRTRLTAAKGILFDLDGTLVESAEIWYQLINGASTHFGYQPVSYDAWKATFGQSMEKNVEMWMVGLDQVKFNEYCDEHYADHLKHLHILDGSMDLLELVNRKYGKEHVAIVTNCPRKITEIILSHLNLNSYFSHIICAGDSIPTTTLSPYLKSTTTTYSLQPKPAIDILLQGAHQLGVASTSECIFVGDSRYDMISGQAAGCATVGVGIQTGDVYVKNTREAVTLFEQL